MEHSRLEDEISEKCLEVKNLNIEFGSDHTVIRAVRGVSFSLYKGEILAIVGETGCGKTVLCKSIIGLLSKKGKVKAGEILLRGRNLLAFNEKKWNEIRGKEIAMVFQDPLSALDPSYPIGKQIEESLMVHQKLKKKDRKEEVLRLLEKVGIDQGENRYYQYPFQLSGGMRQRCVLAVALACEPRILLADEPTTALDVTVQAEILELLQNLQRERQLSILFVTHNLGIVSQIADRVLVMYQGKIVEEGTTEEIFTKPVHVYTKQLLKAAGGVPSERGNSKS